MTSMVAARRIARAFDHRKPPFCFQKPNRYTAFIDVDN
jgi:hypothetical protein